MKLKSFARTWPMAAAVALFFVLASPAPARAQEEGVPVVVDEVIAQVNNDVITLSGLKRELKEFEEVLTTQRGMTPQQAQEEVARKQPEIIASLINEQLLMQKGKEIPRLPEDVEAEVNREMLRVANTQGIKTIEELDAALRASGLDPSGIRQTLRTQFMRQAVFQREVDAKIYFGISSDEARKYFETHREKFRKPESVEFSEIFLSLAGKPEAEVRAKAVQIVTQARGGADFGALAVTHSEREQNGARVAPETKGKVGRYQLTDLRPEFAAALKNLKKGEVTDPIRIDEGFEIFRVDDRTAAGEATFNEEQVRGAITAERAEKEREAYLRTLRKEAYIKISKDYEPSVTPLLKTDAPATASKAATPAAKTPSGKKPEADNSKRP